MPYTTDIVKRLVRASVFLLAGALCARAQVQVYIFPQHQQIPVGGIQTFTAVVTGTSDKGVVWSNTCGHMTNGFHNTMGLQSEAQGTCTVTVTSTADRSKTAMGTVQFTATPHFKEGVHPRLLLTPELVKTMRQQGWVTSSNPYWQYGLKITVDKALAEVDSKWCFSFSLSCPAGAQRGYPLHVQTPELDRPPAVQSMTRDGDGNVTVTMAGPFPVWKGLRVALKAFGTVPVESVQDDRHFVVQNPGAAGPIQGGSVWVPCGNNNPGVWCDVGGYKTPLFDATETYTELFAFMSLMDADPKRQEQFRIRAHDMMMWMIRQAGDVNPENCLPNGKFAAFRNCSISFNDRAHQAGFEAFPLTVDWIYSSFTPAEKKQITHVFRFWVHQTMTTGPTGIENPQPFGVTNSPVLLSKPKELRWQMNNLGESEFRSAAMLSSVMDQADDPEETIPGEAKATHLRDYLSLVQGAWVYIHWAVAEDPGVVSQALHVSPAGLGEAQGGLSPESSEYGDNSGYVAMGMEALHTAGADDPARMPQMSFVSSSYWDLWIDGLLNILSPVPNQMHDGNFFVTTQYGDDATGMSFREDWIKLLAPLVLYDAETHTNPRRLNAERWLVRHALARGTACSREPCPETDTLFKRMIATVGSNDANRALLMFLTLDPTARAKSADNPSGEIDPRPQYPPEFYAPGHHELAARSNWDSDASWMITHCSWIWIDHQHGDCGQTEFYRKGRWLTKAHATYINMVGALSIFSNSGISIANPDDDQKKGDIYQVVASHGAQYAQQGASGFTPQPLVSMGGPFLYEAFDQTDAFNENNPSHHPTSGVLFAGRSVLWLKPDIIVFYDRGVSKTPGFKRDSFNFTAEPVVEGNVARVVDRVTGQQTFLTTLEPTQFGTTVCGYGSHVGDCDGGDVSKPPDESAFLYQMEAKGDPVSAQFLSVMQGADPHAQRTPVSRIAATGSALDGAEIGNSAVLFVRASLREPGAFSSASYQAPAGVVNHYIGGLEPNGAYTVQAAGTTISVSKGCHGTCVKADGAGLLNFTVSAAGAVSAGTGAYRGR